MSDDESRVRRLLHDAVPPLPQPADRVAAVAARVRRTRKMTAAAGTAMTVLAIGLVAGLNLGAPRLEKPAADPGASQPPAVSARTAACARPVTAPPDETRLRNTAYELSETARVRFAESFGQAEAGPDRVWVYRKPSAEFDAWVAAAYAGECVELADTTYSGIELDLLRRRITGDDEYWRLRGIRINTMSIDPLGHVEIGVAREAVARATAEMPTRYGLPIVILVRGPGKLSR